MVQECQRTDNIVRSYVAAGVTIAREVNQSRKTAVRARFRGDEIEIT
jgi:hypothetical protein